MSAFSWLGAVPVVVAVIMAALVLPRGVPPDDLPLPRVDGRALERAEAEDDARAAAAHRTPLPAEVRELGSAIRAFNVREAEGVGAVDAPQIRVDIERLVPPLLSHPDTLLALRAVQLDQFLTEVRRFESSGAPSKELTALGGSFLRSMEQVGWVEGTHVRLDESELRVAFKLAWNGVVGVASRADFAPTPDETRALYTFYLKNPHPSEAAKALFDGALAAARDKKTCDALRAGRDLAAERWRLEKVERLASLDPSYPVVYARGIEQFRLARYAEAARSFEAYLATSPDGPFALRARNYLRAALDLGG